MVEYTIDAVETQYKGINFRSKLEAKWAVFFDLCGWRWEYEPINLNGWYPDFALYGDRGKNEILVEVKPITHTAHCWKDIRRIMSVCADVDKKEWMLLGLGPIGWEESYDMAGNVYLNEMSIGYVFTLREDIVCSGERIIENVKEYDPYSAVWGVWDGRPGFCRHFGSKDFISGKCVEGYNGEKYPQIRNDPRDIWAKAINHLQYQHKG